MAKKKASDGGSFDFEELAKEEGIRKAKDLAKQQSSYRSLLHRVLNVGLCNRRKRPN